jgi:hypothetical protein
MLVMACAAALWCAVSLTVSGMAQAGAVTVAGTWRRAIEVPGSLRQPLRQHGRQRRGNTVGSEAAATVIAARSALGVAFSKFSFGHHHCTVTYVKNTSGQITEVQVTPASR